MRSCYTVWGVCALALMYAIGLSAPITASSVIALGAWTLFVVVVVLIGRHHEDHDR